MVTGTNSGKTLCYNLPALHAWSSEPIVKALYLFPTKALAQDQLGKLESLAQTGLRIATYDGDTPLAKRAVARKNADFFLTNPDMLHVGILPQHELWTKTLRALRFIVLDEIHTYRGIFGSHVGNVIRRLLRLCEWHGARPQIIACSATIGNPGELFFALTGRNGEVISMDSAPRGLRTVVLLRPPSEVQPPTANHQTPTISPNRLAAELIVAFALHNIRSLTFCRARVSVELLLKAARRLMRDANLDERLVESYRAGYTAKDRRSIERALFDGKLMAMIATNAMELGVDVGVLDAVILNGYPGTISSFWQQSGRAGRGKRQGLSLLIAHDDPLEAFFTRKPELLLDARIESLVANPANPHILAQQLRCAAYERGLSLAELPQFGVAAAEVAESLDGGGELEFRAGRFFYPSHDPPAPKVNIRGMNDGNVLLRVGPEELGTMGRWRAMRAAHDQAVYLHRGESYVVEHLDLARSQAELRMQDTDYYTRSVVQSVIEPTVELARAPWGKFEAVFEGLQVTSIVAGFRRISMDGERVLDEQALDLPPESFESIGLRLDLPMDLSAASEESCVAAVHGLEHALMAVAPLLAGCEKTDLGSAWYMTFSATLAPAVIFFDAVPGGIGLSEKLFSRLDEWASASLELLESCPCEEGCPACLMSSGCEIGNQLLNKHGAIDLIRMLATE